MKHFGSVLLGLVFATCFLSSCAKNLCERKDAFFTHHCVGTDVTYSADKLCGHNLEHCSEGQLRAFDAYISCLEDANLCSMEIIGRCAQAHPGGVNLQCPKRS